MRREQRPLLIHKLSSAWARFYAEHYLYPQFDAVGSGARIINPRQVKVSGSNVRLGHDVHMMARRERPIWFTVYCRGETSGEIDMGNYCIVLPGATFISARSIRIGDNCMFAGNCYVSDADWHDLYDRTAAPGKTAPVVLGNNVWIGYGAMVCKGVTVGDNSVVGAGAVVAKNVRDNVVVAGSPAKVVKELDPDRGFRKREHLFSGDSSYEIELERMERFLLASNTFGKWLRSIFWPSREL